MEALLRSARTVLYSSVICCWPINIPFRISLLSPPVIHRVYVGAVEPVAVWPVHSDALCHGFVAVGAHASVCGSARQVHTGLYIGSAGDSESVDRGEKSIETGIGSVAPAHHAELHIAG